jgi:hypothetical protein
VLVLSYYKASLFSPDALAQLGALLLTLARGYTTGVPIGLTPPPPPPPFPLPHRLWEMTVRIGPVERLQV